MRFDECYPKNLNCIGIFAGLLLQLLIWVQLGAFYQSGIDRKFTRRIVAINLLGHYIDNKKFLEVENYFSHFTQQYMLLFSLFLFFLGISFFKNSVPITTTSQGACFRDYKLQVISQTQSSHRQQNLNTRRFLQRNGSSIPTEPVCVSKSNINNSGSFLNSSGRSRRGELSIIFFSQ